MYKSLILAACLIALTPARAEMIGPLDFKGIAIGSRVTGDELEAKFKEWSAAMKSPLARSSCFGEVAADRGCHGYVSVGNVPGGADAFFEG